MSQFAPISQRDPASIVQPPRADAQARLAFETRSRMRQPSFMQRLGASVGTGFTFGTDVFGANVQRQGSRRDPLATGTPITELTDAQKDLLLNGMTPQQAADIAARSRTFEQALDERDRIVAREALIEIASASGAGRIPAMIAGDFLDPTYIAVDLAVSIVPGGVSAAATRRSARMAMFAQSPGMSRVAHMLNPQTRRAAIALNAVEGGVANTVITGLMVSQDLAETEDVVFSAFAGTVLSGAFSAGMHGGSAVFRRAGYGRTVQHAVEVEERVRAAIRSMPDAEPEQVVQAVRGSLTPIERQRLSDMLDSDFDLVVDRMRRIYSDDDDVIAALADIQAGAETLKDPLIRRVVLGDQPDVEPLGRGVRARGPDDEPLMRRTIRSDRMDDDVPEAVASPRESPDIAPDPDVSDPRLLGDDPFVSMEPGDIALPDYEGEAGKILERLGPAFGERGEVPRTRYSVLRPFSINAQHGRIRTDSVRSVLSLLTPDPVTRMGRSGERVSFTDSAIRAVERAAGFQNGQFAGKFRQELFGSVGTDNTISFLRESGRDVFSIERDFAEAVTRAMRGENIISGDTNVSTIQDTMALIAQAQKVRERGVVGREVDLVGLPPDDPTGAVNAYTAAVQRAAAGARETFRNNIVFAARHGVAGAAQAAIRKDDYIPAGLSRAGYRNTMRLLQDAGLSKARARQEIISLVSEAIASGRDVPVNAFTRRMATWIVEQAENLGVMTDFQFTRFLDGDREAISSMMRDAGINLDTAEAQAFLRSVGAGVPDGASPEVQALRERQPINRAFTRLVPETGVVISFGDLLEKDIRTLVSRNSAQLIGAGVMRSMIETARPLFPGAPIRDYPSLRKAMIDEMVRNGEGDAVARLFGGVGEAGTIQSSAFGTRGTADTAARMILGLPLTNNPTARKFFRRLGVVETAVNMGKLGFSIFAESSTPIAVNGWRRFVSAVPDAARFTKDLSLGRKPSDVDRIILEAVGGVPPQSMFGSTNNLDGTFDGKTVVDSVFETMEAAIGTASFGAPIDRLLRFSNIVSAQHFVMDAIMTGVVSDVRLRAMRLTRSEFNRMAKSIKAEIDAGNINVERNAAGEIIRYDIPVEMISDAEQARRLMMATQGLATQNIQPNRDVGSLPNMANSDIGRVLLRFRTWSFSNWEHGVLSRLSDLDANRAAGGIASIGIGGLVYSAMVYNRSTGIRDEKERRKFLEDALSPENLAFNAFARSNVSGVIPMVAATLLGDRVSRNSGLGASLLDPSSIPAIRGIESAGNLIRESASVPFGDPFTDRDLKSLQRITPLGNTLFGDFLFNVFGMVLPEEER